MGLFDRFKSKKPTHMDKVNLAYKCYKADLVEAVFPGKEAQADRIIRSLALIYGLDLEICDAKKYYDILSSYSDIWIRKNITQTNDELATASLVVKHGDLVKDMATAQIAYSYITKALTNSTFVLESREDLKKLNPNPVKAPVTSTPTQEQKIAPAPRVEAPKQQDKHIKLDTSRCGTLDGMKSVLESFCVSIIGAFCKGSGDKYGSLPVLPILSEKDIEVIAADTLLHVKEGAPEDNEPINQAAFNAVTLGMVSAKMMIKDNMVSPSTIKDRYLKKRTSPSWLPKEALMLADVLPRTDYSNKINSMITEMTCDFSHVVSSTPDLSDDNIQERAVASIAIAFKAGCSIFLRDQNIIQGNHSEEDQEALNRMFSKKVNETASGKIGSSNTVPEDEDSRNAELLLVSLSRTFLGYKKFPTPSHWSVEYATTFKDALSRQVDLKQTSYKPYITAVRNAVFIGIAMGYAYRMYDSGLRDTITKELISSETDPLTVPERALKLMNEDLHTPYGDSKTKQVRGMTNTIDVGLFTGNVATDGHKIINRWRAYIWAGFRGGIAIYLQDAEMIHGKVFVEDQRILDEFFKGV